MSGIHTFNLAATFVQVANYITHRFLRSNHFHFHDRLHQYWFSLSASALECHLSTDFERQLVRVNRVETTINHGHFQFIQRITSQYTGLHSLVEALLYSGDILLRNITTLNDIFELKCSLEAFVSRLYANNHISVLTTTTGLLLICLTQLNSLRDSLAVCHLRTTLVTLNFELTFQTVDNDLQVELTHTADDRLSGLLIGLNGERRILLCQLSQTYTEFVEISLRLRLYGNTDHRCRELDRLQYDRLVLRAEGITRAYILKSYARAYITREDSFYRVLVVGVHLEDTTNTFFLTRTRVIYIRTGVQFTRINAEVAETSYIRIGSDLECQCTKRLVIVRLANELVTAVRTGTEDLRRIHRRRQVCTNGIKHRLYTFVLERRTTNNREHLHREGTLADSHTYLILRDCSRIVKIFLHQSIIKLRDGLEHLVAPFLCLCNKVSRNILNRILSTHSLIMPDDCFHTNEINHALECFLCSNRNLDCTRSSSKHLFDLANYIKEVGTRTVHLVHVADTRHIILISLTPNSLRLRLYTTHRAQRHHSTVQDTQRTLYLYGKVHVTRSVYQVDFVFIACVVPESGSSSRGDSDTTLLLLLHPVHRSSTVVYLTDLVCQTRVEQDTLRSSCLTGIDVCHDTDVAIQM